jgi:hypothetical protein
MRATAFTALSRLVSAVATLFAKSRRKKLFDRIFWRPAVLAIPALLATKGIMDDLGQSVRRPKF